ncbi:MAG: NAD-dependent epimerase/dehydratase family protein [Deltaproteobacteria bacterium]|nr:NAD-dependent epimerase/dehydratase family protein [Deltaproteobacteria bacterium]
MSSGGRFLIVGGAGFIGSHFTDHLLGPGGAAGVTLYDNFSSGKEWHYAHHGADARLRVVRADAADLDALCAAMTGHDVVIHLASNPDIAAAMTDPDIDFRQGTVLTRNVAEAMRRTGTRRILYASGSGIYGDLGEREAHEDHGPLIPVSPYGASKLAGEALLSAYAAMFDLRAVVFRFGNVVGPRQTHGVGFDFIRRLRQDPTRLRILGDGMQSKSYIHVSDVVAAVLLAHARVTDPFRAFNVATGDYITVRDIAEVAVECAGLTAGSVTYELTGGRGGWKGDVPVIRLNTDRIRALGWTCSRGCRDALRDAMNAMRRELDEGHA